MFQIRKFGDLQLEHLYRLKQFQQHGALLVYVLCVLTVALLLVALNHLAFPDLALLWATVSAGCALGLNIRLNCLTSSTHHPLSSTIIALIGFWTWIATVALCAIVPAGQLALLPTITTIFILYTVFPFDMMWTVAGGVSLSMIQLTSFIVNSTVSTNIDNTTQSSQSYQIRRIIVEQLLAILLVHLWTNFIGVYLFCARNRLCRAAFLNARNALASQRDAITQNAKMGMLLSAALPNHVITSVQNQLGADVPKIYVEHHAKVSVIYAKLYGLQAILKQISPQDSARLLNEFDYRIDQLARRYNFIRIQSDAIVVVAGVPQNGGESGRHVQQACHFAKDLCSIIRSFSDATAADLQLRVGIGMGSLSSGIVGARKWHYDVIGIAFDSAKRLESKAPIGAILIADDANRVVERDFVTERVDFYCWKVLHSRGSPNLDDNNNNNSSNHNNNNHNHNNNGYDNDYSYSNGEPYCNHGALPPSLLFASAQKRFSLVAVPQAISRLLQSSAIVTAASASANGATAAVNGASNLDIKFGNIRGRRKRRNTDQSSEKNGAFSPTFDGENLLDESKNSSANSKIGKTSALMHSLTLRFCDLQLERDFRAQIDRWLIPALTISILFLILNTLYQMLVMPRLLSTLALTVAALLILFAVLLILYVQYFESFCQFITRTSSGHSITILLIIVVLFVCGIVNTFSCGSYLESGVCHEVHYATISCVIWMLTTVVFIRFGSFHLLCTLVVAIATYSIHVFKTHESLYLQYSLRKGWHVEYDIIVGLVTLALIIFIQARRNERMIRVDYLSVLKTLEETQRLERLEYLNEQIVFSALPAHIAHNYLARSEPYQHLCQSVGVLSAQIGRASDWQGEFGFDRLNRVVFEMDRAVERFVGVEKVRSAHCVYTCAVGVLPEIAGGKNVNDAPYTISDLLASLSEFALQLKQIADNDGLEIAIGIDCGPSLSLVVGQDRPHYDLVGAPCERALQLMTYAFGAKVQDNNKSNNAGALHHSGSYGNALLSRNDHAIFVSEEIFLALRPRQNSSAAPFHFDDRNAVTVAPALVGYALIKSAKVRRSVIENPNYHNPYTIADGCQIVNGLNCNNNHNYGLQKQHVPFRNQQQPYRHQQQQLLYQQQQTPEMAKQQKHSSLQYSPLDGGGYDNMQRYSCQQQNILNNNNSSSPNEQQQRKIQKQQKPVAITRPLSSSVIPGTAASANRNGCGPKVTMRSNGITAQRHSTDVLTAAPFTSAASSNSVVQPTAVSVAALTAAVNEQQQQRRSMIAPPVLADLSIESLSATESSMSETDFDEIDERVAAAACAREKAIAGGFSTFTASETADENSTQSTTLPTDIGTLPADFNGVESLALPSDLRALTKDKRMSGYLLPGESRDHLDRGPKRVNDAQRTNSKRLAQRNPFEMFASMNSLFSSELYSVDMSVESDSEIEWVTPEMIAAHNNNNNNKNKISNNFNNNDKKDNNNNNKFNGSVPPISAASLAGGAPKIANVAHNRAHSGSYVNDFPRHQRQYSDQLSESENQRGWGGFSARMKRKRFRPSRNGPKLPSWLASSSRTSLGSQLSMTRSQKGSYSALDRLDAAARRVDKMLQELASVDGDYQAAYGDAPFPLPSSSRGGSTNALVEFGAPDASQKREKSLLRREMSSACHTEYDNADSEGIYSDSELMLINNYGRLMGYGGDNYDNEDTTNNNTNNDRIINNGYSINDDSAKSNEISTVQNNKNNNSERLAQKLKRAFMGASAEDLVAPPMRQNSAAALPPFPHAPPQQTRRLRVVGNHNNNGNKTAAYEADIDSNCSSLASSLMFLNATAAGGNKFKFLPTALQQPSSNKQKWKSVHSVGYEDEYEFISESDYCDDSSELNVADASSAAAGQQTTAAVEDNSAAFALDELEIPSCSSATNVTTLGAFDPTRLARGFVAMDAEDAEETAEIQKIPSNSKSKNAEKRGAKGDEVLDARGEVTALSRDIRRDFGDYQLATFSDIDA